MGTKRGKNNNTWEIMRKVDEIQIYLRKYVTDVLFFDICMCFLTTYKFIRLILRGNKKAPCGGFADRTGLEPATSAVTGRHSNQLNYRSSISGGKSNPFFSIRQHLFKILLQRRPSWRRCEISPPTGPPPPPTASPAIGCWWHRLRSARAGTPARPPPAQYADRRSG